MRILVASLLLFAACNKTNENFCPGLQDNHCKYLDAAPEKCTASSGDCVCLMPEGICVECTDADKHNCTPAEPACDQNTHQCRGCRADDECPSRACLGDGTCADASRVIYAAPNGVNATGCGLVAGQNECSVTQAITEIAGQRNIIRLAPGTYGVTALAGIEFTKTATLIARSAMVINRAAGTGPIITVQAQQSLTLVGGTLRGPNLADGIRCDNGILRVHETIVENMSESGIEGNSCDLTISRSTLRNNLRGGINMIGDPKLVQITNNFVYLNGGLSSTIGGMVLKLAGASKVEFNTVIDNVVTSAGGAGGIQCDGSYDAPFNLVFRNRGGIGDVVQVIGTCTFMGSFQQAAASGTDNSVGFKDPNNGTNPDYRLTESSSVREAFVCRDEIDFEGDVRPQPAGGKCDFGADEYRAGQ